MLLVEQSLLPFSTIRGMPLHAVSYGASLLHTSMYSLLLRDESLCSKPPIVSRQDRSIDVAGVIGGQKGNHRCDLFWPGRPSRRALHNGHHPRQSCLVGHATPHPNPRFDAARANRIATNATLTVMKGNTPG